jgi:hypothetical protein
MSNLSLERNWSLSIASYTYNSIDMIYIFEKLIVSRLAKKFSASYLIHYIIHKGPSFVQILRQMNQFQILSFYSFKFQFNIMFQFMPRYF